MKDQILQKIREMGVTEDQVTQLYELLSEEVVETLYEEIADKSTDEELEILKTRLEQAKSTEHFESILSELATTAYGDQAQSEIFNIYLDLIDGYKQNIQDAKALVERANSGDPNAQKLLEEAKKTEEYQNIVGTQE